MPGQAVSAVVLSTVVGLGCVAALRSLDELVFAVLWLGVQWQRAGAGMGGRHW